MRRDDQHEVARAGVVVNAAFAGLVGWWTGWTVRRDWPDGSHEFVGFHDS